jgi:hypothetical protein
MQPCVHLQAGGPPAPCFVLSERFLHLQLQLGAGITRSASVQRAVGSCEEVNFAKLALRWVAVCVGLGREGGVKLHTWSNAVALLRHVAQALCP